MAFISRVIYSSATANFQTLRPNFCTSSSSRRCSRAPRCRSSASRWATLRRTSPGLWMGFLFRKTTGKTSNFSRANVPSEKKYGIPKLDPPFFIRFLSPDGGLRHQKSTDTREGRLFAVINPRGITRDHRGKSLWKLLSDGGGSCGRTSIAPRGLRFSEPIERKITNHAVQSGRF